MKCLCGNNNEFKVYLKDVPYPKEAENIHGKADLLKCKKCGVIITNPLPQEALELKLYKNQEFIYRIDEKEKWKKIYQPEIDKICSLKKGGRLLDIGCNVGLLASMAQKSGFEVRGIDVNESAIQWGRENFGLELSCTTLEKAGFDDCFFDVIISNHVIEHIYDMKKFLAEVRRILKDGGFFLIGAPNISGGMAMLAGRKWDGLQVNQHLWHFNGRTLKKIIEDSYFEVIEVDKTESIYFPPNKTLKGIVRSALAYLFEKLNSSDNMLIVSKKS